MLGCQGGWRRGVSGGGAHKTFTNTASHEG